MSETFMLYAQWLGMTVFWIVLVTVVVLLAVAYLTYAERKVLGAIQRRQGPMTVGPFGLLQPIADGVKLFSKETIIPSQAHRVVFLMAPMILFALSLIAWAVIPFNKDWVIANINVGVLYLFAISSMGVYGVIMAGWASNSRYAFLGGLRSASQMVSYEVSMGLIIVCVLLCAGSLNLQEIVLAPRPLWMQVLLFPMFIVFLISILAETNRAPFDLPEGESEITGGFMVEYSAMTFALFFLGEYANMILMSAITTTLFLGGWLPPFGIEALSIVPGVIWFGLKTAFILFIFLWARGTLPRYRYDQLMRLGWKVFLPFTLLWVVLTAGILVAFDALPNKNSVPVEIPAVIMQAPPSLPEAMPPVPLISPEEPVPAPIGEGE
ncbi:MAG: NADH-quinone oxidoreductase subunit NuoH [Alphaproteobacteria bacterium]|jgi:NADH-quinone oxidoreductase subunit H|nr:NADH-quinone oxidoreductase subunit NuoH [Alphaproteobacteria bacterium]QQS56274.1 MAG: NADH-quinone oxidoreductase subunit NuoH [Alphaproteobacteria bacterium]